MYDVITLGSATVDLFVDTESELLRIDTPYVKETHICYPSNGNVAVTHQDSIVKLSFSDQKLSPVYLYSAGFLLQPQWMQQRSDPRNKG